MVNCCILSCKNRTERNVPGISYHAFPHNEVLQTIWVNATGRRNWKPSHTARICSKHFDPRYIKRMKQKTYLRKGAIPTIRVYDMGLSKALPPRIPLNLPSAKQKKIPKRDSVASIYADTFTETEKNMIVNVYKNIEKSWPTGQTPYKTLLFEKTATFLGLPLRVVSKILRVHECNDIGHFKTGQFIEKIEQDIKYYVQKAIHNFYMERRIPTTKKIYQDINNYYPNINPMTFKKILEQMKFQYVKKKNIYGILDNEDIISSRVNYMRKIKEYRKEKRIYYVDEMALWQETGTESKKNRMKYLTVVHIGDKNGFLKDGLGFFFTNNSPDIKATSFEKWFKKILANLEENSIVVIDNKSYHSSIREKTPKMEWSKENIKTWLRNNNIEFKEDIPKIELISKAKRFLPNQLFELDKIVNSRNIKILRSPLYHDLNPLKTIWADIKADIMKNNPDNIEGIRNSVEKAIENVPETKWLTAVNTVVEKENFYSKLDVVMDDVLDEFLERSLNISSSDSTASCDS